MMALQRQMEKVHQQEARKAAAMTCAPVDPTKNGSDDDDDEEDEEFQRYRLQRLQQMKEQAAACATMPRFGEVEDADINDFCDKVDHPGSAQTCEPPLARLEPARCTPRHAEAACTLRGPLHSHTSPSVGCAPHRVARVTPARAPLSPPPTARWVSVRLAVVVVCLQEEYIASCARLSYRLEELAAKYDQVRFIRVVASEVKPDLDPVTLPQLVIYQDGQYKGELSRVGRDEGEDYAAKDLEHALLAAGVRLTAASEMRAADAAALQRLRELGLSGPSAAKARSSDSDGSDDEEVQ